MRIILALLFFCILTLVSASIVSHFPFFGLRLKQTGGLIVPPARADTSFVYSASDSSECSGASTAGSIGLITGTGSRIKFEFLITETDASGSANCSFYLETSSSIGFKILTPLDKDVDENGAFACGENPGKIESALFEFEESQICESCVLKWVWEDAYGPISQCADIEIQVSGIKSSANCFGLCENYGICQESTGTCSCVDGWEGTYCETEGKTSQKHQINLFLIF